jgi:hypothetical protein
VYGDRGDKQAVEDGSKDQTDGAAKHFRYAL